MERFEWRKNQLSSALRSWMRNERQFSIRRGQKRLRRRPKRSPNSTHLGLIITLPLVMRENQKKQRRRRQIQMVRRRTRSVRYVISRPLPRMTAGPTEINRRRSRLRPRNWRKETWSRSNRPESGAAPSWLREKLFENIARSPKLGHSG